MADLKAAPIRPMTKGGAPVTKTPQAADGAAGRQAAEALTATGEPGDSYRPA